MGYYSPKLKIELWWKFRHKKKLAFHADPQYNSFSSFLPTKSYESEKICLIFERHPPKKENYLVENRFIIFIVSENTTVEVSSSNPQNTEICNIFSWRKIVDECLLLFPRAIVQTESSKKLGEDLFKTKLKVYFLFKRQ